MTNRARSTVAVSPGLKSYIKRTLVHHRLRVAARAAAITAREILDRTPVEDGHAHEAWIQAATQAMGQLSPFGGMVRRAIAGNETFASGDPEATKAGWAAVEHDANKTVVTLINRLGFVRKLEYGGVIKPTSSGRKVKPAARRPDEQGPLYGPRENVGRGLVFYRTETGGWRMAKSYQVQAGHYAGRALDEAAADAGRQGLKTRRRRGR